MCRKCKCKKELKICVKLPKSSQPPSPPPPPVILRDESLLWLSSGSVFDEDKVSPKIHLLTTNNPTEDDKVAFISQGFTNILPLTTSEEPPAFTPAVPILFNKAAFIVNILPENDITGAKISLSIREKGDLFSAETGEIVIADGVDIAGGENRKFHVQTKVDMRAFGPHDELVFLFSVTTKDENPTLYTADISGTISYTEFLLK